MSTLTRLSFLSFFAGTAGMAVRAPAGAAGGSGLSGPATTVVGNGRPLNLKGVIAVQPLPARIKLSSAAITVHYPPSNAELQQEIDNLSKQIGALQQNEAELWKFGDVAVQFTKAVDAYVGGLNEAVARHWHDYDDGIGAHSTSRARM